MPPSLLITRPLPVAVMAAAAGHFKVTPRTATFPMTEAELIASLRDHDAVLPTLGDRYSAGIFAAVTDPRCRILANFGVGYDHIDVEAARSAGIAVTNTPGAVTDATADIGVMLMLMSARRASEGEMLARSGKWEGWHPTQLLGMHLSGKTVGIVGYGRIGRAVARRCHFGFGMTVRYFNRSEIADPGLPATACGSLHELMATTDVVVISLAANAQTRGMIDAAALGAMQPHAHLVNIARGDVVDEAALIAVLQRGGIAGAGLDVYAQEPKIPQELREMPKVTLLPHLGTATVEVRTTMGLMAVENLVAFLKGGPPPNLL